MQTTREELRRRRQGAYESSREEVQALVPSSARQILDLGCSSGALGAALKQRQGARVVGVEIDTAYAQYAADQLDTVVVGDVEVLVAGEQLEEMAPFDCVIAADVLEHLRDPWSALRAAVGLLGVGGTVVVSVPNVRHWETFLQLGLRGTWPRRDEGIFDRSHLRWFALHDLVSLVEQAGLQITRVSPRYRLKPTDWQTERQGRRFARTPLGPFFVFQYVLAAVKVDASSQGAR